MDAAITAAVIAAVASIVTAIFTYVQGKWTLEETRENNLRTLTELQNAERRKQCTAALQELLFPLHSQLMAMKALSQIFYSGKPQGFRVLTYLLDPANYKIEGIPQNILLSDSDKKLLEEMIDIERRVEDLLVLKGGLIDDPALSSSYIPDPKKTDVDADSLKGLGLFSIAIAHFRVFRLAYQGALKGEVQRYEAFVYPRELNDKVDKAIQTMRSDLSKIAQPVIDKNAL